MAVTEVCPGGHDWYRRTHEGGGFGKNEQQKVVTVLTKLRPEEMDKYNPRNVVCVRCHQSLFKSETEPEYLRRLQSTPQGRESVRRAVRAVVRDGKI